MEVSFGDTYKPVSIYFLNGILQQIETRFIVAMVVYLYIYISFIISIISGYTVTIEV